jgi:hypothetical protein
MLFIYLLGVLQLDCLFPVVDLSAALCLAMTRRVSIDSVCIDRESNPYVHHDCDELGEQHHANQGSH